MSGKRRNFFTDSPPPGKRQSLEAAFVQQWRTNGKSLIYRLSKVDDPRSKVACFDLDGTLVKTKGTSPFPRDANDWVFAHDNVIEKLQDLFAQDFKLVIFSNQGGIKSSLDGVMAKKIKQRIDQILKQVEVPMDVYLSTLKDTFRKPETGMWDHFLKKNKEVNKELSFYVGDAAGRLKDFSDSDLRFAENIGLDFFTPEDYFTSGPQTLASKTEEVTHSPDRDSVTTKKRLREEKQDSDEEHQSNKTLH